MTAYKSLNSKNEMEKLISDLNSQGEKWVLIDVREEGEWEMGRAEGALHCPLSEIHDGLNLPDLNPETDHLILYCAKGIRSAHAAEHFIEDFQFKKVYNLEGGFKNLSIPWNNF